MKPPSPPVRAKRRVAVDAAMALVIVLLITQMWLLTATLESYLAGHHEAALPGVIASGVLFLAGFGLYRLVVALDRAPEPEENRPVVPGPWEIN